LRLPEFYFLVYWVDGSLRRGMDGVHVTEPDGVGRSVIERVMWRIMYCEMALCLVTIVVLELC
jgi:hypothetical protein